LSETSPEVPEAPSVRKRRWSVPVAEVLLVAAVWISLQLAGDAPREDAGGAPSVDVSLPGEVPGFRADAWYLPDEELLGFVEVPAGPFVMGSDPAVDPLAYDVERWSAAQAQDTIDLPTFYLARYEVTVAQYAAFVRATGHVVVEPAALQAPPDHPVTNVSWTDALAYARWLDAEMRQHDGVPPALARLLRDGWHVGLPTEAQWEKGARGADGRLFPWGDEPRPERAVFGARGPESVGSRECPECPYGLADMGGNVWEWTRSPYQPYPYDATDDREGLDSEALWVMRGGAFNDGPRNVRAAGRGGADPGARRPFIGFRLALSR
jgi:formylglycine-generating enzyme required for sulfatase activity